MEDVIVRTPVTNTALRHCLAANSGGYRTCGGGGAAGGVKRVTKSKAAIINAVTASGTIVADGILAASNPMWIASLTVDAPITRAVVNAALYAAGDVVVDTVAAGFARLVATLAIAALAAKALKKQGFK